MTRISTASMMDLARGDILRAQRELSDAQKAVSSQRKADDLKGFGGDAQTLVSANRLTARAESYIDASKVVRTRLDLQDAELGRVADSLQELRGKLIEGMAVDNVSSVPGALQSTFEALSASLNVTLGGRYLFGGARDDVPVVVVDGLDDLVGLTGADALQTDPRRAYVQIDETKRIETNPLPQDFATEAFDILRQLHEFAIGPSGPFDGKPTGAQIAFLSARLQDLDASITEVLNAQGANGRAYQEAERAEETQTARRDLLLAAAGEIADVDLAEAAVRLTLAQNQFQASAQAFTAVRGLSLLEFLR